jgi:conjugal transfer mating pair stabilization protein TraG
LNPNALAASTSGWNDVFGAASPARFVSFNVMSATPGFDTCANVAKGGGTVLPAQSLSQRVTAAVSALSTFYGKELNPYATRPAAASAFDSQIAAAYNFILGSSQSAADALQQAMFVNAFREAQGDIATLLNDPAAIAQLNAETQGAVATNAALLAQANVAQDTLPRVRNITEVFLYVVFPLVVLFCLVSSPTAAANILAFYILGLAWIALWPVMFAVLHFLMTLHLAAKAKATLLAFNGVPLQHQNLLAGLLISEQALIGSLAYAVPAIAAGLVFLSRGPMTSAFTSLASTGQAQVASEAAATTKGNYSIGQSGLNTVSENLTLKARYDGDSHFLSGFHQGRIGAYAVTQVPDGDYVVNRPVNQLGVQATDAVALANGSGQSASSTLSSGRSQEASFRVAQSAGYNESVGR